MKPNAIKIMKNFNVMSNTFVIYFSYHQPIVTVIPSEATSNVTITKVTYENN
jgi:hypothetical protein